MRSARPYADGVGAAAPGGHSGRRSSYHDSGVARTGVEAAGMTCPLGGTQAGSIRLSTRVHRAKWLWLGDISAGGGTSMRADFGELITEIQDVDQQAGVPLGTAQWMGLREANARLSFRPHTPSDRIWLGEACVAASTPLGYADDRHVCLVSVQFAVASTGLIIPNLCLWPGSCIVIDPKGENATVTARRRGNGFNYAHGMGQEVRILDLGEVQLASSLRASFNPLDVIDPQGDFAVDDAGRIAASIIVRENKNDPFFEDAARNLLTGLILHGAHLRRALTTFATSSRCGACSRRAIGFDRRLRREAGEENLPSGFVMLWLGGSGSSAFDGIVACIGEQMLTNG